MKAWLVRVVAAGALAAVVCLALVPLAADVKPIRDDCMDVRMTLAPEGSRVCQVSVLYVLETAPKIRVTTRPTSEAAGIRVLVLRATDLARWKNRLPVAAVFDSSDVRRADLDIPLRRPERFAFGVTNYEVLFSNRGSAAPRALRAVVTHEWIPTGAIRARQGALLAGFLLVILCLLLLATWRRKAAGPMEGYAVPPAQPAPEPPAAVERPFPSG